MMSISAQDTPDQYYYDIVINIIINHNMVSMIDY